MSEQEQLSKLAKDISTIKRWWPGLTIAFAILIFIIKLTFSATSTYDNKIAKKEDIAALSKQVVELSKQIGQLADDFRGYKSIHGGDSANLSAKIDSLIKVGIRISTRRRNGRTGFVLEYRDRYGNITTKPAQ